MKCACFLIATILAAQDTNIPQAHFPEAERAVSSAMKRRGLTPNIEVFKVKADRCAWSEPDMRRIFIGCGQEFTPRTMVSVFYQMAVIVNGPSASRVENYEFVGWEMKRLNVNWFVHKTYARVKLKEVLAAVNANERGPVARGWNRAE